MGIAGYEIADPVRPGFSAADPRAGFPGMIFKRSITLTFEEPDVRTFRNLGLAIEALNKGATFLL